MKTISPDECPHEVVTPDTVRGPFHTFDLGICYECGTWWMFQEYDEIHIA